MHNVCGVIQMKQVKLKNILLFFIYFLYLLAEIQTLTTIYRLGMLPGRYFFLLLAFCGLLTLLTGILFFTGGKKTGTKAGCVRQIIAVVLSAAMIAGNAGVTWVSSRVNQTLDVITEPADVNSVIAVYVLADDPAVSLEDMKEYTFAASEAFDALNTQKAFKILEEELGAEPAVVWRDTVFEAVDELYEQSVTALVLNEAYADILEDMEGYADFPERTRTLYEIPVTEQVYVRESQPEKEQTVKQDDPESSGISNTPFILYLSGSDTRSKLLKTSRSDVNILVAVNPVTKQILLVNTPRDYYVPNPAGNGALDKLTHCGVYGIQCSEDALSDLYGIPVDYYVQINFTGFETLIDAIGGVDVYFDTAFTTLHGKFEIQKGYNHLNGSQALGVARERYALAGGDNDRGKNQMKIITAMIKQMSAKTVITKYSDILDSLQGMFLTDMTAEEISELVRMQLSDWSEWTVNSCSVTGRGGRNITYSMPGQSLYVMYPDEDTVDHAASLINRIMAGDRLEEKEGEKS